MIVFSFSTVKPSVCAIEFGGMSSACGPFFSPVKADQIAAMLRLLAFRIEPDAELGAGRDFLADGVHVLIPRDRLARQHELAGARPDSGRSPCRSPIPSAVGRWSDEVLRIVRRGGGRQADALC